MTKKQQPNKQSQFHSDWQPEKPPRRKSTKLDESSVGAAVIIIILFAIIALGIRGIYYLGFYYGAQGHIGTATSTQKCADNGICYSEWVVQDITPLVTSTATITFTPGYYYEILRFVITTATAEKFCHGVLLGGQICSGTITYELTSIPTTSTGTLNMNNVTCEAQNGAPCNSLPQ